MLKKLRIPVLAIAAFALQAHGQEAGLDTRLLEQKIDQFVTTYQPAPGSGVSVALIRDGKIAFFKGYGFANRAQGTPVTTKTIFNLGSSSKSFTSMAIAMLHDQGLDLNAPVHELFPDFAMYDPQATAQMTLTDMLSHRSGLPRHEVVWELTPFSRDEIYRRIRYLHPNPSPGMGFRGGFQYNNLMYISAGQMLERYTHQSWEQFVRERIFSPLGMNDSGFAESAPIVADWASPYHGTTVLDYQNLTSVGPAGSVRSNAEDLAKWVGFLASGGITADGARLVTQESFQLLLQPQTDPSSLLPAGLLAGATYGMGWFTSQIDGEKVVWHPGNVPGYTAHVSFMPSQKLGVVVLINQDNASLFEFPIAAPSAGVQALPYLIYDHVLRHQPLQPIVAHPAPVAAPSFTGIASTLKRDFSCLINGLAQMGGENLSGTYEDPGYGVLKVEQSWESYVLNYYGTKLPLCATSDPDVFTMTSEIGNLTVHFSHDANGARVVAVPFEPQTDPVAFIAK